MLYTEKEKHEIERVKEVFAEHLRQSPDFELLWCAPILFDGKNFREENAGATRQAAKDIVSSKHD